MQLLFFIIIFVILLKTKIIFYEIFRRKLSSQFFSILLNCMKKHLVMLIIGIFCLQNAFSQGEKVNLFYDCQSTWKCRTYFDFIRTEIKMANFVNDRFSSDVHLMITEQSTGAGGSKYYFNFWHLSKIVYKS